MAETAVLPDPEIFISDEMPAFSFSVCGVLWLPLSYVEARRISRRLGEEKICGRYFLYDLLSPFFALLLGLLLLRKDERVWR